MGRAMLATALSASIVGVDGVPVRVERADAAGSATLAGGHGGPAVLTGRPSELLLFVYGRSQVRDVQVSGPDDAVAALRATDLGL